MATVPDLGSSGGRVDVSLPRPTRRVKPPGVSSSRLVVTGSGALPNTTVTVYRNGTSIGTATADPNGRWTLTLGTPLNLADVITFSEQANSPGILVR